MTEWGTFIHLAGGAKKVRPAWSHLSEKQIAHLRRQQQEADEQLELIVSHLKQHGRMTTANLAFDLKWTTDAVYRRCERGIEKGLIKKSSGVGRKVYWSYTDAS